jgi:hypothetical protein
MTFMGLGASLYRNISAKTAAYQILPGDIGKIFTNRGASGSVTLTLPVVTDIAAGWWCRFFVAANQALVIASQGSSDNITCFNELTGDTITIDTSAERIGFGCEVVWDGTGWDVFVNQGETQTITIS